MAQGRRLILIRHPKTIDASVLPTDGFGVASPAWWGTLGFMFIEGSSLVLCAMAYSYLSRRSPLWPPSGTPLPSLTMGTVVVAALLISLVPAWLLYRAAKRMDRGAVVLTLLIGAVVEAVLIVLRAYELHALPMRWDGTAYGSTVWFTLGAHSTLLLLDFGETLVFAALLLWGPADKKHFADVADSAMYWFFIVLIWVPLYFMLYVSPRIF
jgi:cytochrome c oxidase subunit 3